MKRSKCLTNSKKKLNRFLNPAGYGKPNDPGPPLNYKQTIGQRLRMGTLVESHGPCEVANLEKIEICLTTVAGSEQGMPQTGDSGG